MEKQNKRQKIKLKKEYQNIMRKVKFTYKNGTSLKVWNVMLPF